MLLVYYCIQKCRTRGTICGTVAAFFGPQGAQIPVGAKSLILVRTLAARLIDLGSQSQFFQIVNIRFLNNPPVGEVIAPRALRNAGFQGAFDGIASQIVCTAVTA